MATGAAEGAGCGTEREQTRPFDLVTLTLLLLTVASVLEESLRLHHDPANLLMASLRWVEGRARLADMAGMNLPLSLYLYGVPAFVSHALGVHPIPVFSALTFLVLGASVVACRRLLGRGAPGRAPARALVGVALAGLLLASREGPERAFGQREVFFVALVMPFLLVRWRRSEGMPTGNGEALLAGVAGALGSLLKPQLILATAAAEGALWLAGRRSVRVRTPEVLAFAGTGLAYGLHFLLLPAGVTGAFGAAVAGAVSGYRAYDVPLPALLLRGPVLLAVLALAAAMVASRAGGAGAVTRLAVSFSGLAAGGLAVYFLQHKGFPYHLTPVVTGTALAFTAIVADGAATSVRDSWRRGLDRLDRPFRAAARVAPFLAATSCVVAASRLPEGLALEPRTRFEEFLLEATSPREELLVISTSVGPLYPALLRTDRRPFGRWIGPFMGIAFAHADDPRDGPPRYPTRAEMGPEERRVLDALTQDLLAAPPRLVLVAADPPNQGLPLHFDLVEYLRVAGFLDEALGGFERMKDRAGFSVYRRRTPRASPIDAATHSSIGGVRPG